MTEAPLDPIRELFVRAGWYEGRAVDVTDVVAEARARGVQVSAAHERWLQEFEGLVIERAGKTFELSRTRMVDPASDDFIATAVGNEIGVPVLAVGAQHHAILLVEDSGAVWGCFPSVFGRLGDDIFDAADATLRKFPSRPFDRELPDTRDPSFGSPRLPAV